MRNYGQHNALLCGIRAAKYELIVTMDDDLQHPPRNPAAACAIGRRIRCGLRRTRGGAERA